MWWVTVRFIGEEWLGFTVMAAHCTTTLAVIFGWTEQK
jgi:hypothetical protein